MPETGRVGDVVRRRLRTGRKPIIAAAGLVFVALLAVAGLKSHHPPSGVTAPVSDSCGHPEFAENLRIAANAKLPVPATVITTTTLPSPSLQEFADQTHIDLNADAVRRRQAEGESWTFTVDGDQMRLTIKVAHGARAVQFREYTFPHGSLVPDSDLTAMVTQLRTALIARQVGGADVEVTVPAPGPDRYTTWGNPLDLNALANEYETAPATFCEQWSRRQVDAWAPTHLIRLPVDILNLGNGIQVGFGGHVFAIETAHSGVDVTTWYHVPALNTADGAPVPVPVSPEKQPPGLAELRKNVSFPIFAPTAVPLGLAPQWVNVPAGNSAVFQINYGAANGGLGLSATSGPAGCCLDADTRKTGQAVPIRNGITGHFLINQPEFGGPILWWDEAGAYVALSGPQLTKEDLVSIANAMSAADDLSLPAYRSQPAPPLAQRAEAEQAVATVCDRGVPAEDRLGAGIEQALAEEAGQGRDPRNNSC